MDVLENKVTEMTEDLGDLKPGSEEYLNQAKAIAEIAKANADNEKVTIEGKHKKIEKWTMIASASAAVVTAAAGILREVLKRRTNKDVLKVEEEDVVTSKAFDNR